MHYSCHIYFSFYIYAVESILNRNLENRIGNYSVVMYKSKTIATFVRKFHRTFHSNWVEIGKILVDVSHHSNILIAQRLNFITYEKFSTLTGDVKSFMPTEIWFVRGMSENQSE